MNKTNAAKNEMFVWRKTLENCMENIVLLEKKILNDYAIKKIYICTSFRMESSIFASNFTCERDYQALSLRGCFYHAVFVDGFGFSSAFTENPCLWRRLLWFLGILMPFNTSEKKTRVMNEIVFFIYSCDSQNLFSF